MVLKLPEKDSVMVVRAGMETQFSSVQNEELP